MHHHQKKYFPSLIPMIPNISIFILTLLAAYALKYHYSRAGSDGLYWILAPVAALTKAVSGIPFFYETRTGFVSAERLIVIAPSCAGINFMIMIFLCWVLAGVPRIQKAVGKFIWWGAGFLASYAIAVVVNALRILVSIHLYQADIYSGWITPERVHRMEGIVIYFGVLLIVYQLISRFLDYRRASSDRQKRMIIPNTFPRVYTASVFIPLFCYLGITLLVPLLNGAAVTGTVFAEHWAAVFAGCAAVIFTGYLIKGMCWLFYPSVSNTSAASPKP